MVAARQSGGGEGGEGRAEGGRGKREREQGATAAPAERRVARRVHGATVDAALVQGATEGSGGSVIGGYGGVSPQADRL